VTETKLGKRALQRGRHPLPLPEGSFLDVFPVSVITTSALDRLGELQPGSRFDVRRFRMNVIVATPADGFVENSWIGKTIAVGERVKLAVSVPDPRCVMTTVAQEGLERDPQILKALAQHNRLDFAGAGLYPCAGVYAVVASSGTIRTGDPVTPAELEARFQTCVRLARHWGRCCRQAGRPLPRCRVEACCFDSAVGERPTRR
jgi:uncharacterized protein YcbX